MLGFFKRKLMPARSAKSYDTIADLDAMIVEPVSFKLHGKIHVIKPLTTEQFFILSANLNEIYKLKEQSNFTAEQLIDKYYELMSTACKTITRKDIEDMEQYQVSALFELVVETITGKIFAEKKKIVPLTENKPPLA